MCFFHQKHPHIITNHLENFNKSQVLRHFIPSFTFPYPCVSRTKQWNMSSFSESAQNHSWFHHGIVSITERIQVCFSVDNSEGFKSIACIHYREENVLAFAVVFNGRNKCRVPYKTVKKDARNYSLSFNFSFFVKMFWLYCQCTWICINVSCPFYPVVFMIANFPFDWYVGLNDFNS